MLGEKKRSEPMFYHINVDALIPENHLLRLVTKYVDFSFIREQVKHLYSHTGRPSVDPEILLKMLLVGYLYGINSERRLCEEINMHIGYRWFVGLTLEDKIPDHSTFSKNRHERFSESGIFQGLFDEIVGQCIRAGLLTGRHLTVDSTNIKANASIKSLEPIVVEMKPQEYIKKLEQENPVKEEKPWEPGEGYPHRGETISNETHRSQTDPDARLARKSSLGATELSHAATYVMDSKSRIILGTDIGKPDKNTDCKNALKQLQRIKQSYNITPQTLGADKGYCAGEFIDAVLKERIQPHIPIVDNPSRNEKGIYPIEQFTYDKQRNLFVSPEGKEMKYHGIHKHSRQHVYRANGKDCGVCPKKTACTRDRARSVSYHLYEDALQAARWLNRTAEYRISQRMRKRIEELFGEAKEFMGLRRAKFRGAAFVREQVMMTATAQNIKRMVKMLARRVPQKNVTEANKPLIAPPLTGIRELFYRFFRNGNILLCNE